MIDFWMLNYPCFSRIIQLGYDVWSIFVQLLNHIWLFVSPMDYSTPVFPVFHHLLELAQTHIHCINDAIQPSHPLLPLFPLGLNLSQHQGLFQWIGSLHQVAEVLEFHLQQQAFQWIFRTDFLQDWLVWSPCSPRDSQESSPTPQFKSINSSVLSFFYGPAVTSIRDYWENIALTRWILVAK